MANSLVANKISKHIDLSHHMIQGKGIIQLNSLSAEHTIADFITKALDTVKRRYFTATILQDEHLTTSSTVTDDKRLRYQRMLDSTTW